MGECEAVIGDCTVWPGPPTPEKQEALLNNNNKVNRCLARYSPRAEANNGTMQYHAIP